MGETRLDGDEIVREYRAAHFGFLDGREDRHALEFEQTEQKPAGRLCHGFDQQHARHQWVAGKVSLEDRAFLWDLRFDNNLLLVDLEVDDAIDHVEVFELHRRVTSVPIPKLRTCEPPR